MTAAVPKVAVVGAGISGLSAASTLLRMSAASERPLDVWLMERSDRPGGWVRTEQRDGCLYELGPRTIRGSSPSGRYLLDMVRDCGLAGEIVALNKSHPAAKRRLVCIDNRLTTLGGLIAGNLFCARPPFRRSLIGWVVSQWLAGGWPPAPLPPGTDQPLYAYARARLGPDLTEFVLDPLTRGIYAGELADLGAAAAFPMLVENERRAGSLLLGLLSSPKSSSRSDPLLGDRCAVWSLRRGLGSLADACARSFSDAGVRCLFGVNVEGLRLLGDGQVSLRLSRHGNQGDAAGPAPQQEVAFDHVLLCVSAHVAARIWPERLQALAKLPSVSLAVVSILYGPGDHPLARRPAFGHLVPSGAAAGEPAVLGAVYDSCLFPDRQPAGAARLTCMLGGAWHQRIAHLDSDGLVRLALDHLAACLGPGQLPDSPAAVDCRTLVDCIPQYPPGHGDCVAAWRAGLASDAAPVSLVGAAYDGVSVPDCARSGAEQAAACFRRLMPS